MSDVFHQGVEPSPTMPTTQGVKQRAKLVWFLVLLLLLLVLLRSSAGLGVSPRLGPPLRPLPLRLLLPLGLGCPLLGRGSRSAETVQVVDAELSQVSDSPLVEL